MLPILKKYSYLLIASIVSTVVIITVLANAATPHGINLSWTQSTSSSLALNTVYAAPTSAGPFQQIFQSTSPITSYLDPLTTSNQGTQRCYVVTVTNSTGIESVQSTPPACGTFPLFPLPVSNVSGVPQ